ncbi:MAG: PEP-CTERM sorting domain-containing protein, partial [Verrucomicrobia bacterium]|nr:PEP-CTERM sorting domain-containing protein [Verrucomicrobiota bacterium]
PFGSNATSLNQTFDLGTSFNGGLLASNLWTLTVADMQTGATARFDSWTLEVSGIPEPSSASLLGVGIGALLALRLRRRAI